MKTIFQYIFTLLTILLLTGSIACAQGIVLDRGIILHKVKLSFSEDADSVSYTEVLDSAALRTFAERIDVRHFPVCVVKKPVVGPFINLVRNYGAQIEGYKLLEEHYKTLDTIQTEKLRQTEHLVALQKERVENYRSLSNDLLLTNKELSTQLDQALKVASDCNKGKVRKQWRMAILGGAVGFSVASLIAIIK